MFFVARFCLEVVVWFIYLMDRRLISAVFSCSCRWYCVFFNSCFSCVIVFQVSPCQFGSPTESNQVQQFCVRCPVIYVCVPVLISSFEVTTAITVADFIGLKLCHALLQICIFHVTEMCLVTLDQCNVFRQNIISFYSTQMIDSCHTNFLKHIFKSGYFFKTQLTHISYL